MPQTGYVPDQAAVSHPAQRKRANKSPRILSAVSSFLQAIGLQWASQLPTQESPQPSSLPSISEKLTGITGSTICDASTSFLSDESSLGSPASLSSDYSNTSSATSLANEFSDSPASLSCPITTHSPCIIIKSTTAPASNKTVPPSDLLVDELVVSLHLGPTTCSVSGEDYSTTCTENGPFDQVEADSDGWFQHSIPWPGNSGKLCGGDRDITLDDWRRARSPSAATAPREATLIPTTNQSTSPKIGALTALNGVARFVPSDVPVADTCIEPENDIGVEDWRITCPPSLPADPQTPSYTTSLEPRATNTAYRPAAGVLDPSDGQVWMFYDSDSDVDDEDERDVHKAFMEHLEECRRRKQIGNGKPPSATTTGLDSPAGGKSARPAKRRKASWRWKYTQSRPSVL